MHDYEEPIDEVVLDLQVEDERKRLTIPVPYDYDGEAIVRIASEDIQPPDAAAIASITSDGTVIIKGAMDAEEYSAWQQRARGLGEIDTLALVLDDAGLTPGEWPGPYDERTGEPTELMLDETIDHDLRNASVVANEGKAAFRAAREASGASQAALADALGVNVRTVKRWETPGQPMPPRDARALVDAWRRDAEAGARWHVRQAENLREDFHEAYILTLYRSQDEFDRVLAPLLALAPSYRWQDTLAEARSRQRAEPEDVEVIEVKHEYTNFPGTRSYWRANAAARLAAALMDERGIPHGFAYLGELEPGWGGDSVWVPRADVQRIEAPGGTIVACGMR